MTNEKTLIEQIEEKERELKSLKRKLKESDKPIEYVFLVEGKRVYKVVKVKESEYYTLIKIGYKATKQVCNNSVFKTERGAWCKVISDMLYEINVNTERVKSLKERIQEIMAEHEIDLSMIDHRTWIGDSQPIT